MVNAQEWIDKWYPRDGICLIKEDEENFGKKRSEITRWNISSLNLTGSLNLSDFPNLTEFYCAFNQLTVLDVSNLLKLEVFKVGFSQLKEIIGLSNLLNLKELEVGKNYLSETIKDFNWSQLINLERLQLAGNNLECDLDKFSSLTKLTFLDLGMTTLKDTKRGFDEEEFKSNNKVFGSLSSLENLTNLENLCIANQLSIKGGLEFLSTKRLTHFGAHGTYFVDLIAKYQGLDLEQVVDEDKKQLGAKGLKFWRNSLGKEANWKHFIHFYSSDNFPEFKLIDNFFIEQLKNKFFNDYNEQSVTDEFLNSISSEPFPNDKRGNYFIAEQITNQIIARIIILQNRLKNGKDEKFEIQILTNAQKRLPEWENLVPKSFDNSDLLKRKHLVDYLKMGNPDLLKITRGLDWLEKVDDLLRSFYDNRPDIKKMSPLQVDEELKQVELILNYQLKSYCDDADNVFEADGKYPCPYCQTNKFVDSFGFCLKSLCGKPNPIAKRFELLKNNQVNSVRIAQEEKFPLFQLTSQSQFNKFDEKIMEKERTEKETKLTMPSLDLIQDNSVQRTQEESETEEDKKLLKAKEELEKEDLHNFDPRKSVAGLDELMFNPFERNRPPVIFEGLGLNLISDSEEEEIADYYNSEKKGESSDFGKYEEFEERERKLKEQNEELKKLLAIQRTRDDNPKGKGKEPENSQPSPNDEKAKNESLQAVSQFLSLPAVKGTLITAVSASALTGLITLIGYFSLNGGIVLTSMKLLGTVKFYATGGIIGTEIAKQTASLTFLNYFSSGGNILGVFLASPAGIVLSVIVGIAFVAGGVYLIYNNWSNIVDFFANIFTGNAHKRVKAQVETIEDEVKEFFFLTKDQKGVKDKQSIVTKNTEKRSIIEEKLRIARENKDWDAVRLLEKELADLDEETNQANDYLNDNPELVETTNQIRAEFHAGSESHSSPIAFTGYFLILLFSIGLIRWIWNWPSRVLAWFTKQKDETDIKVKQIIINRVDEEKQRLEAKQNLTSKENNTLASINEGLAELKKELAVMRMKFGKKYPKNQKLNLSNDYKVQLVLKEDKQKSSSKKTTSSKKGKK